MSAAGTALNATLHASARTFQQQANKIVQKNLALIALLLVANQDARNTRENAAVPIAEVAAEKTSSGAVFGYIPLGYRDVPGRNGRYYLPASYASGPIPIMVILHGAKQDGTMMAEYFSWLADKYRFAIVAPDSKNPLQWEMADSNKPLSTDWQHVQAAYNYVTNLPGVSVDKSKVLYAGFSRGGYSAIALASRLSFVTHSLVMHSSAVPTQVGWHRVPVHFSTGVRDPLFTPARLEETTAMLNNKRFPATLSVYKTGHSLSSPVELEEDVQWWLNQ